MTRQRRRTGSKTAVVLGVVTLLSVIATSWPGSALASSARTDRNPFYLADPGEQNNVTMAPTVGGQMLLTDTGATITAGPGCVSMTSHQVLCTDAAATIDVGDQNDVVLVDGTPTAIVGGSGNDVLTGADGFDTLIGGLGDDTLNGRGGDDFLAGSEAFQDEPGNDTINGGDGNDGIGGGAGTDTLNGGPGVDSIGGGVGDDTLSGGDGNDGLTGGLGADVLNGGAGIDWVDYGSSGGSVTVTLDGVANDGTAGEGDNAGPLGDVENVFGSSSGDTIVGNAQPNQLDGYGGNDTLSGGPGDDILRGGDGIDSDVFNGGDGIDTASYASHCCSISVALNGLADDGASGEGDNVGPLGDVENVVGGLGDDTLRGNGAANLLDGGPGDDLLQGRLGADTLAGGDGQHDLADYSDHAASVTVTLDGVADDGSTGEHDSAGTDVEDIVGTAEDDTLVGNGSANRLDGGLGDDVLEGRQGPDALIGGPGLDLGDYSDRTNSVVVVLDGQVGDGEVGEGDTVGADVENAAGGSGDDTLTGNGGDNRLDGGSGDDVLDGRQGSDRLIGGPGLDLADYSDRVDKVTVDLDGQSGDDGEAGEGDTVGADVEDVFGGESDDVLNGNASANFLFGGGGDDLLDGGLGADDLIGGPGVDDTVTYSSRTSPVTVALNGSPTSGESGEGDMIESDVEDAIGGSGADAFVGNGGGNIFDGGQGGDSFAGGGGFDAVDYSSRSVAVAVSLDSTANDGASGEGDNVGAEMEDVFGGAGNDHFTGDAASNLFVGGAGADGLDGAGGDDLLIGQSGADSLTGGSGDDFFDGGADDDSIQSRDDLAEDVSCGTGTDGVVADLADSTTDCESVHRGPPLVTTAAASEITNTTAKLGGTVNPAGQPTTAYVEIGTTTAYGTRSTTLSLPPDLDTYAVSSTWSGLEAATTYHYRLVGANADGTTSGADQTFTTAGIKPAPIVVPDAPTGVSAYAGNSRATVSWSAPGSDGGSAITNYVVTPFIGGVAQASTTVGNVTSATITGLTNGTSYTFKVAAKNTAGTGPQSAASNAVTPKAPQSVAPKCVVPNVVGKQLGTAKTKIKKAHCRVGTITYRPSTRAKMNRVLAERPKPRTKLKNGARVNLTVGRGGKR